MDPEIKRLVEETQRLVRENNHLLRTIRRYHWYGVAWKIVLWAGLIIIPIYFYQNVIAPVAPSFLDFSNLLESYQMGQ